MLLGALPTRRLGARAYVVRAATLDGQTPWGTDALEALAASRDAKDRSVGLSGLVLLGRRDALQALTDPDPTVRRAVAVAAINDPRESTRVGLLRLTHQADEHVRGEGFNERGDLWDCGRFRERRRQDNGVGGAVGEVDTDCTRYVSMQEPQTGQHGNVNGPARSALLRGQRRRDFQAPRCRPRAAPVDQSRRTLADFDRVDAAAARSLARPMSPEV